MREPVSAIEEQVDGVDHFQRKYSVPQFQKLVNSSLPICWINMDVIMLILGSGFSQFKPSSSDELDVITC